MKEVGETDDDHSHLKAAIYEQFQVSTSSAILEKSLHTIDGARPGS